jgi:hypothetical protein
MYSLTYAGIIVALAGTFLVNTIGLTEACSTEVTSKIVEFGPLVIGSIVATIGRWRQGDIKWYGARV